MGADVKGAAVCNGPTSIVGKPHIFDRSGRHQLPVGIESFDAALDGFTYVDKTLAACELMDRGGVTLSTADKGTGHLSAFLHENDDSVIDDTIARMGLKHEFQCMNLTHPEAVQACSVGILGTV